MQTHWLLCFVFCCEKKRDPLKGGHGTGTGEPRACDSRVSIYIERDTDPGYRTRIIQDPACAPPLSVPASYIQIYVYIYIALYLYLYISLHMSIYLGIPHLVECHGVSIDYAQPENRVSCSRRRRRRRASAPRLRPPPAFAVVNSRDRKGIDL